MSLKYDKIFVVDIEACCWENNNERPEGQEQETLEVGICSLNLKTLEIENPLSLYVRPDFSSISEFCTQLTGIAWDMVKCAPPFVGVCNKLVREVGTKKRIWASWGNSDKMHFLRWCEKKDIDYPFSWSHIDIKTLYTAFSGNTRGVGLKRAVAQLNKEFKGKQHSGKDDAVMAAEVLKYLISFVPKINNQETTNDD